MWQHCRSDVKRTRAGNADGGQQGFQRLGSDQWCKPFVKMTFLSLPDRWEPEAGAWKLQLPMTLRLVTGGQGLFRVQMEAG